MTWSARHRTWLRELAEYYEMVWATTWEHKANEAIARLLGLRQLDVIEFNSKRQSDTWKLTDVKDFVGIDRVRGSTTICTATRRRGPTVEAFRRS